MMSKQCGGTYLDFDQLLDAVNNEDMLVSIRPLANDRFVASAHVPVLESLGIRFVILQVPKHHCWTLDEQLARLIVPSDLVSFNGHNLAFDAWQNRPRRPEPNVLWRRRRYDCACLGQSVALSNLPRREDGL
jgi:hypothetical protein